MQTKLGVAPCLIMSCLLIAVGTSACGGESFEETQPAQVLISTPEPELPAVITTVIPATNPDPTATPVPPPTAVPEPQARTTAVEYTVAAGDALGIIADRYDVKSTAILDANPTLSSGTLQVGQVITIPAPETAGTTESAAGTAATATPVAAATPQPTAASSGATASTGPTNTPVPTATPIERDPGTSATHRIQSGDILSRLAAQYGVSVAALEAANPGISATNLRVNADLAIPPIGTGIDPAVVPTVAPTPTPLNVTPVPTATPDPNAPTATPTATADPNAPATATPTVDPNAPTATPTPTPDPAVPTATPTPTVDPTLPTATPTATPDPAIPTATPTLLPAVTATPTVGASATDFGFPSDCESTAEAGCGGIASE